MIDFATMTDGELQSAVDLPELQESFDAGMAELTQSYYASKVDRYLPSPSGVSAMGSGADFHYRLESEFLRMVERARLTDRDNMVVGQGVNRLIANLFQGGFTLDPQTGDPATDAELRQLWRDWSTDADAVDVEGERDFHGIETGSYRASVVDGDMVILPTKGGALQTFEAHRLRNPFGYRNATESQFIHGVELGANQRRVAYWLTFDDLAPRAAMTHRNRSRRYLARDPATGERQVFHIYNPARMSQRRGVTAFAPTVLPINYHDDLQFATMVKAKVASYYAIIRERELGTRPGGTPPQRGTQTTTTRDDGSTQTNQGGSPGAELRGIPGERIKGFAPNIPNAEFFSHANLLLSFVAINLDLPMIVFLLDASKSNFSAWRGAIDQSRMRFKQMQRSHLQRLHRPTYRWKVRQWLAGSPALRAASKSGVDVFAHRWIAPRWNYIEPAKDAAANELRLSSNQATLGQIAGEQGMDLSDLVDGVVDGRAQLAEAAIARAAEINAANPEAEVSWRELAYGHKPQVDLVQAMVNASVNDAVDKPDSPAGGSAATPSESNE